METLCIGMLNVTKVLSPSALQAVISACCVYMQKWTCQALILMSTTTDYHFFACACDAFSHHVIPSYFWARRNLWDCKVTRLHPVYGSVHRAVPKKSKRDFICIDFVDCQMLELHQRVLTLFMCRKFPVWQQIKFSSPCLDLTWKVHSNKYKQAQYWSSGSWG